MESIDPTQSVGCSSIGLSYGPEAPLEQMQLITNFFCDGDEVWRAADIICTCPSNNPYCATEMGYRQV